MQSERRLQVDFIEENGLEGGVALAGRLARWSPADWPVAPDWQTVTDEFFASPTGQALGQFVSGRLAAGALVYPPQPLRALALTPLASVRVVILGQDPYHGPGQAEGLAFSVQPGVRNPPSLRNIFQEVQREQGAAPPANGSLVRWAEQGVLLLNTCLTVEDGLPGSHAKKGWEALTDSLIQAVAAKSDSVVFLLWGAHAQAKRAFVNAPRHGVLLANHPSPLAARRPPLPFMGCGHFSAANQLLAAHGHKPVEW